MIHLQYWQLSKLQKNSRMTHFSARYYGWIVSCKYYNYKLIILFIFIIKIYNYLKFADNIWCHRETGASNEVKNTKQKHCKIKMHPLINVQILYFMNIEFFGFFSWLQCPDDRSPPDDRAFFHGHCRVHEAFVPMHLE